MNTLAMLLTHDVAERRGDRLQMKLDMLDATKSYKKRLKLLQSKANNSELLSKHPILMASGVRDDLQTLKGRFDDMELKMKEVKQQLFQDERDDMPNVSSKKSHLWIIFVFIVSTMLLAVQLLSSHNVK